MNGTARTNKTNPYRPTPLSGLLFVFVLIIILAFVHSPHLAARSFESCGTAQTYAYSYDTYGRLTSGTHSGGNGETIVYDANGNITSLTYEVKPNDGSAREGDIIVTPKDNPGYEVVKIHVTQKQKEG